MGKTSFVLFYVSWLVENQEWAEESNKPTLIACPTMLVESWASEAMVKSPNLKLGIMYADAKNLQKTELASRAIPSSFTKDLPNMKGFPKWLLPAFTDSSKRNP